MEDESRKEKEGAKKLAFDGNTARQYLVYALTIHTIILTPPIYSAICVYTSRYPKVELHLGPIFDGMDSLLISRLNRKTANVRKAIMTKVHGLPSDCVSPATPVVAENVRL